MNQKNQIKKAVFGPVLLACFAIFALPCLVQAQDNTNTPPKGFTQLFNGKNLDGWYAIKTLDPRKMNGMSEDEQKSKIEAARKTTGEFW